MEDVQPNEVRLSRKGLSSIPRVRTTRPVYTPYRRSSCPRPLSSPHNAGPPKGIVRQPPSTRAPLPSIKNDRATDTVGHGLVLVEAYLPPECHKDEPGSPNVRKRWIEDQTHRLQTNRYHSVVSFKYSDDKRRVLFTCRTRQAVQQAGHYAQGRLNRQILLPPSKLVLSSIHIASGSCRVGALSDSECISTTRQGAMTPSMISAHGNQSNLVQSKVPGPSRARLDSSHLVQFENTSSLSPYQATICSTSPTRNMSDPFLDPQSSVEEHHSTRWSTFRSGHLDIYLPSSSSDSRVSSTKTSTEPQSSINQTPIQARGQPEETPSERRSDSNPHSIVSSIRASDGTPLCSTNDHPMHRSLVDQLPQRDATVSHRSSYSHGHSVLLQGEARALISPPDPPDIVPLSLGPHDKPRRLLHNDDSNYVVTAHGVIDQVGGTSALKWERNVRSPPSPFEECVDDACVMSYQGDPIIILGHAREQNQVSLVNLERGQASRHISLRHDWNTTRKSGVSAVTSLMSPLKFASGGYDHRVHVWDIAQDLSDASAVELAITHTSAIHSLLPVLDSNHKLVSVGADRNVHIYDMSAERVAQTLKVSCVPYHAHKTDSMSCILLEVSHLETQFEVRDYRMPNQAIGRFGFVMEERRGRFDKAATWSHFVACGDRNGAVHVWDRRNVSKEVNILQHFSDPVIQVVNTGSRLLACSRRNELAYIDLRGDRI